MYHQMKLFPFLSLFFFFSIAENINPNFTACEPQHCGNGNYLIKFPFMIQSQGPNCGLPGFKLRCDDYGNTILSLGLDNYSVNRIFYNNQTLRVSPVYPNISCPQPLHDFTLPTPTLFSLTQSDLNLTLFNCSGTIPDEFKFDKISCLSGETHYSVALLSDHPNVGVLKNCESRVSPVLRDMFMDYGYDIGRVIVSGFELQWTAKNCSKCEGSGGRCGYDTDKINFMCFCPYGSSYNFCKDSKPKVRLKIIIGISAVISTIILAGSFFAVITYKSQLINIILVWKKPKSGRDFEKILKNYGTQMPKRYSYSDVKKMTKFLKIKLGEGGYGSVFKGQLIDGRLVAVKILSDSKGKGEDFINEVATIGRTAHVNIVRLVGFCLEGLRRALVYEFMPNGSLEKFNFSKDKEQNPLGWETLFKIVLGIARGLEYLHRGCNMRILHFDIKPHNILLDQDFCPKISDFGLAKLCSGKNSIVSMTAARGTVGYIAPELIYRSLGGVSHKSDVYSYGMLLLEMVGVRKNTEAPIENNSEIYFPDWIYNRIDNHRNLQLSDYIEGIEGEVARKLIIVGLWCIQTKPIDRPSMSKVVEMLEGNLEDLHIPPKPILSSLMEVEYAAPTNIETSDSLS